MTLEYMDDKGRTLKGFSQIDLNKLNQKLKWLLIVFTTGIIFLMSTVIWLLWQMKKYKIVTYMIQTIG